MYFFNIMAKYQSQTTLIASLIFVQLPSSFDIHVFTFHININLSIYRPTCILYDFLFLPIQMEFCLVDRPTYQISYESEVDQHD